MILKNEILRKQCDECLGIWFKFWWAHGNKGYFRLSPLAPDSCSVCRPLDEELESNAVYTRSLLARSA